jgi:hypothetical protein
MNTNSAGMPEDLMARAPCTSAGDSQQQRTGQPEGGVHAGACSVVSACEPLTGTTRHTCIARMGGLVPVAW